MKFNFKKKSADKAWPYAIILALIAGFYFLKPFISIIMLAALLAFFTTPTYKKFLRKFKGKVGLASFMTTLVLFLILFIPAGIVVSIAVAQAIILVNDLGVGDIFANNTNIEGDINSLADQANSFIESLTGAADTISVDGITSFLKDTLPGMVQDLADALLGIISGIPAFFMNLIIFLFVYIGILTGSKQLIEIIQNLSPFDRKVNDKYFERIGLMATAMLKGQLIIAFLQGLATAIGLAIVGMDEFFFFFLLIFTFMSIIPLGAGIITIPLGIFMLLTGNVWRGLVVLGNHFLIVTNIDNFRPLFVPVEARLPAALTILAAFSGVAMFGVLGVIYGPIIMIIIVTTIETYIQVSGKDAEKSV